MSEKYYLNDGLKKIESCKNFIISDGVCRSLRMDIMRHLPPLAHVVKSVDGWVWQNAKKYVKNHGKRFVHFIETETDNWKYGLNVNGLNNITRNVRQKRAKGRSRPFYIIDCPIDIRDTIPHEILDRLKDAKKFIPEHSMTLPDWVPHRRIV